MAFKLNNANVDLLNKTAHVVWVEYPTPPATQTKMVQVNLPFVPPHSEKKELEALTAEAKTVLQQLLGEI